jgi:hypothetical protein
MKSIIALRVHVHTHHKPATVMKVIQQTTQLILLLGVSLPLLAVVRIFGGVPELHHLQRL